MLYNGVFRCHGNICYVIFVNACFCKVHSIGPINVCANFKINRYGIDEFRKLKIICFIRRHVTFSGSKVYGPKRNDLIIRLVI